MSRGQVTDRRVPVRARGAADLSTAVVFSDSGEGGTLSGCRGLLIVLRLQLPLPEVWDVGSKNEL